MESETNRNYSITIEIDEEYENELSIDWLEKIVTKGLLEENVSGRVEVELLITSDEDVRRLNSEYRQLDETTDVLAFALQEEAGSPFILPPDSAKQLGNVIISVPKAVEQAKEANHSVDREIAILTIHGLLHLLGYDHLEDEEAMVMQGKERAILSKIPS